MTFPTTNIPAPSTAPGPTPSAPSTPTTPSAPAATSMSTPDLTVERTGSGRAALVLHGGGGPFTVAAIAGHLSGTMQGIVPTHPGWNGTDRPAEMTRIGDLAGMYLAWLSDNGLRDVLVVGSSLGGWIGAEMALRDTAGIVSQLVLIDAVGIAVEGEPIRDFFALDARGVAEYSFHDADRFYRDPATVPEAQAALQRANIATMRVFAGDPYMHDPALAGRLGGIRIPALAIWGDSDRIVTPAYGAAFAAAIPGARFEVVTDAGHLPQLEQPAATFSLLDAFARAATPA